jgi:hypothetical protein
MTTQAIDQRPDVVPYTPFLFIDVLGSDGPTSSFELVSHNLRTNTMANEEANQSKFKRHQEPDVSFLREVRLEASKKGRIVAVVAIVQR